VSGVRAPRCQVPTVRSFGEVLEVYSPNSGRARPRVARGDSCPGAGGAAPGHAEMLPDTPRALRSDLVHRVTDDLWMKDPGKVQGPRSAEADGLGSCPLKRSSGDPQVDDRESRRARRVGADEPELPARARAALTVRQLRSLEPRGVSRTVRWRSRPCRYRAMRATAVVIAARSSISKDRTSTTS
jgi:hypothetical protein